MVLNLSKKGKQNSDLDYMLIIFLYFIIAVGYYYVSIRLSLPFLPHLLSHNEKKVLSERGD